ncbi:MAG: cell division protein FtsZ [Thermodesulfobacteriota bacterium]
MTFTLVEKETVARIKVIGVGGGGGNAVNTMVESGLEGVEFVVANTDMQALKGSRAETRLQLGPNITRGLGAGANPEKGREAAEESAGEIKEVLKGSDMVFITAGLGGGTGSGAAPVIARISKQLGILTVAVVTRPFVFEGRARAKNADRGWDELREHVDTIITIPNDRLIALSQKNTKFIEMMKTADDVLVQAVKGITDLINLPGYINPDFADLRTIMKETGPALMGSGQGVGENRAKEAVKAAVDSPLLQDISIEGARGVLVNISARQDSLQMSEMTEVSARIQAEAHEDANIILGVIFDETLGDAMRVTVIATGISQSDLGLPENVKPLFTAGKKGERVAQKLPFDGDDGQEKEIPEDRKRLAQQRSPVRNIFPQEKFVNEEDYETPAFIRRSES